MSASLDAKCFSDYFGGAKAVHIQGRQYPVDTLYTYQPESDYLDATLVTIFQVSITLFAWKMWMDWGGGKKIGVYIET